MASSLEHYVNMVQTMSSTGNFTQLCDFINKSSDTLAKNASHLDNVYATLDIQQASLGVLGILCVKFSLSNMPDLETTLIQTTEFLAKCNGEHVRYATDNYAELCHKFAQAIIDRKMYARGIAPLVQAIQKIQIHPAQLTSIHSSLCQLCLLSKNLKPALVFLDIDITDISREGGRFDAKDYLLYYYYGGMIYLALKNYERALYCFEIVITTPSVAVSHIMMEAYKKFTLVSLILHGKIISLPKYTPQVLQRYIKPLCQAYMDLAAVYLQNNLADLRMTVTKHTDIFNRDNNMGLVKQCMTSLIKKNIQRLTKTFLTLSLADMANRVQLVSPKEAEKYVLHMIEDREIFATINQKDGMVRFHDNPENFNSPNMLLELDKEMQRCIQLDEKLRDMDRDIAINPQYVQKSSGSHDDDLPGTSGKIQAY
ncbi:COP9 signalosome complex subunit 3-like isoform X1 [Biomphalaria glabrata]|uniref:COP9 signalosome complex subunit 3 n=2 Tax=Biomphalaria glabrata TaxID=6526 RepID=A0A9W2ZR53_BIOGL|nr:COP9 signalosome complex subunit 3-like isoform X1 [Biomphalaria glabrata]KAI8796795.1 COP9 signalosome complex subunit 3 [Biomphalaria glabrata]